MERITTILARLFWTFSAAVSLYTAIVGHTQSSISWIIAGAALITCALCWLSYPWAWMASGIIGFLILAYQSYVIIMFWLAFAGSGSETIYTVSYGPIHIKGFIAKTLLWGDPLFGFIVTGIFTYFGACRSDAKNHA